MIAVGPVPPHPLDELGSRDDPPRRLSQDDEEVELRAGQPDRSPGDQHLAHVHVDVRAGEVSPVAGNSASTEAGVAVTAVGTYSWRVTYSGDAYNTPGSPPPVEAR